MKKNNQGIRIVVTSMIILFLTACGGGGGSGAPVQTGGNGNGGGNTNPPPPASSPATATFIDSPVSGLGFQAAPSGTTGTTDGNGGFTVQANDKATFNIGGLVLGESDSISNGDIITPAELAGNRLNASDSRAIRIARLLQSLDNDGDTSNGITITSSTTSALAAMSQAERDGLKSALDTGVNFDASFGAVIDNLTAGNAVPRAEGSLVSAGTASFELMLAVNQATGGGFQGSRTKIVAAANGSCPVGILSANKVEVFGQQFPVCVINQNLFDDVTLTNDHVYVIDGIIAVGNGDAAGATAGGTDSAVITVMPGTQIYGRAGTFATLIVTRGSRLEAAGTPDMPIVMGAVTATGAGDSLAITDDPELMTDRGQWVGVILSGNGISNNCNVTGDTNSFNVPNGSSRFYGSCTTQDGNSGTLEYVIIAEAGQDYVANGIATPMPGLTNEAVGTGTRLNFIQVIESGGDGIRTYGGAAAMSHLVITGYFDDGMSFHEGYSGTVQTALIAHSNTVGNLGIYAENNNLPGLQDDEPVTRLDLVNVSILGGNGGTINSQGMLMNNGFGGEMWRSVITDTALRGNFDGGCMEMRVQIDAQLAFRDVLARCSTGGVQATASSGAAFRVVGDIALGFVQGTATDETGASISADRRDFRTYTSTINTSTWAVDPGVPLNQLTGLPAPAYGYPIGNYFGAVDPSSGNPDGNPNNNSSGGGPFWDGWTYRHANVDANLPGGANFHPLEAEITQ